MENEAYRESLTTAIEQLVRMRHRVMDLLFQTAITGELKEWADDVPVGDEFTFTKEIFAGCVDPNMVMLVDLVNQIEHTVDSLCDENNLPFPQRLANGEEEDHETDEN